jgi:hypothetical protein
VWRWDERRSSSFPSRPAFDRSALGASGHAGTLAVPVTEVLAAATAAVLVRFVEQPHVGVVAEATVACLTGDL